MSYLSRAQSFVERGEIMRAFYQLVNGLQRNPSDEPALDLLVDLYIREFHSPGVERDLLLVLETVPQGIDIYEMIFASLEKSGDDRRLKSLVQTKERENLLQTHTDDSAPITHASSTPVLQFSHQQDEQRHAEFRHATSRAQAMDFSNVPVPQAQPSAPASVDHAPLPFDLAANPRTQETQKIDVEAHARPTHILDTGDTEYAPSRRRERAEEIVRSDIHSEQPRNAPAFEEEGATTGVFSSIDHYLDEEHRELRKELAQRGKIRLLWIGIAVAALIALLIFLAPSRTNAPAPETAAPAETEEETIDQPKIEEPLPADETP